MIQDEFRKKATPWKKVQVTPHDIAVLEQETAPSEFDPTHVRKGIVDRWKQGECSLSVYECKYGKVVAIYDHAEQEQDIPWELWSRILRMYSNHERFTIYFLANTHLRMFPEHGAITPYHINGGYTYPCQRDIIVIYRAEDATRVLLHELLHASCTDSHTDIDLMEAETEAWAELLYVAFLSAGHAQEFKELIKKQSAWIQSQNHRIRQLIQDKTFPWRYTIGKEQVWKRWGILQPSSFFKIKSLRLTIPSTFFYSKRFGVRLNSVIL